MDEDDVELLVNEIKALDITLEEAGARTDAAEKAMERQGTALNECQKKNERLSGIVEEVISLRRVLRQTVEELSATRLTIAEQDKAQQSLKRRFDVMLKTMFDMLDGQDSTIASLQAQLDGIDGFDTKDILKRTFCNIAGEGSTDEWEGLAEKTLKIRARIDYDPRINPYSPSIAEDQQPDAYFQALQIMHLIHIRSSDGLDLFRRCLRLVASPGKDYDWTLSQFVDDISSADAEG